MARLSILTVAIVWLIAGTVCSQQVVITDFPIGVGASVKAEHFKPYESQLRQIADTMRTYPLARVIVTGGADGEKYRRNQDALNPGLAIGRAHLLREMLVRDFGIDSLQILVQSEDTRLSGADHRFASVRVDRTLADLDTRLKALETRPPVERIVTQLQPAPVEQPIVHSAFEDLGLQFGAGASSSPYGGIPLLTGAVTWKRVLYIEALFGHTFWNGSFRFQKADLATKRRMIGTQAVVYPMAKIPVGVVGGWVRIEEISQHYYEYVKMSEGPMLGLRAQPFDFLSVTGVYNPAKHRLAGSDVAEANNDQFLLNVTAHVSFGGAR